MFVFLSKLLPPFVYPLGLACLLIALVLVSDWIGSRRSAFGKAPSSPPYVPSRRATALRRFGLLLALALLWLGGSRWAALGLARSLEWRYLPPAELPAAEAIVLLGGGTQSAAAPRPMVGLNDAGDRVLYAVQLYRQGKAPLILISGGLLNWVTAQQSPAQDMSDLLQWMGVPQDVIVLQPASENTHDDAVLSGEILRERGIRRILLVTSAFHMPRSVMLFEAEGFEVIPAPTDFTVVYPPSDDYPEPSLQSRLVSVMPSAENLALTTRMLKEYLGIWVYRLYFRTGR